MSVLLDILIYPFLKLRSTDDNDLDAPPGFGFVVPLSLFWGFGIYQVIRRYHKIHNSPKPFDWHKPAEAEPAWESIPIKDASITSHLEKEEILPPFAARDRKYITSFDPATSFHIGTIIADDEQDIRQKIRRASEAQASWKETTFTQRRRFMRSLLKWLVDNQEACAQVACRDTGKTLIDAALGEILTTCSKLEWLIAHGEQALRPESRSSNLILSYKKSEVHYEPLGVVAGIVSWNYPLHNSWSPIIAALFAGNGIVLKCSEKVIWSSGWFVGAITECLRACGHDSELVQLVCCYPEEAEALTKSPEIKHITFIGSDTVGKKVAIAAAENLTPVTLELGGKDPAIILPDTDLKKWLSLWMRGIYQNAGQNCIGIERLIVHSSQYDDLRELLSERVSKLRLGSVLTPTQEGYVYTVDCGAMIDGDRFYSLERLITSAEENGAYVEGGKKFEHVYLNQGTYFSPTIVGPVSPEDEIAQTELFAPIALLMIYEDVEEAIDIANGTKYGLGASVFGPDQRQCLQVAKELQCGMVSINDFGVFYLNQDLPFGGTKASGYGRFGGPEGLRALTNPKAIMVDRWPSFIQTSIPKVLDYPLRSLSSSWDFTSGLIRFVYADSWRTRVQGLITLWRAARK
ncbi:aldehyde dehydrogenase family protein [Pleurotus pulmonarius]